MSNKESGPAIRFADVQVRFEDVTALRQVNVTLASSSFVAIVGASGSGKSTLLRTINRLVERQAGDILLDEISVVAGDVVALRRRIGYVFQNIGLFPHMTIAQNIAIGLRISGERDTATRVAELLALVDLSLDIAERMPDQLSGGQRQRVGVARALLRSRMSC